MSQKTQKTSQAPQRGEKYLDLAESWLLRFPIGCKDIGHDKVNDFLIEHGQMEPETSMLERCKARGRFLDHLRSASSSPLLRARGITGFEVHCNVPAKTWRTVSLRDHIKFRKEASKMRSQGRRSQRKAHHILQGIDRIQEPRAFAQADVSKRVIDIGNKMMDTLHDQLDMHLKDMDQLWSKLDGFLGTNEAVGAAAN
jgi:hypothetical protein